MSTSSKTMIVLKTSDGGTFEVDETEALQSETIKLLIDDDCAKADIPLANITSKILAKVLEYTKRHAETSEEKVLESFDRNYCEEFDMPTLFDVISAANYLDIKNLLQLTCKELAGRINDKSYEEVREIFNVENDYTPEEEKAVRDEYPWVFEEPSGN